MTDRRSERLGEGVALRGRVARGTVINATFLTFVMLMGMSRG